MVCTNFTVINSKTTSVYPPLLLNPALGNAALPRGVNVDVETVARGFHRANRREVEVILESLGAIGLVVTLDGPEGRRGRAG